MRSDSFTSFRLQAKVSPQRRLGPMLRGPGGDTFNSVYGKCKSQVGDAPVLSFDHSNGRRFSLTRFPRLQAGLDDQSHSNSNRVGNVGSIADTASVPGGLAGLFSLETSRTPSAVSHRVRRRHAVYGGGRVDGNGLPRFGSLSYT